MFIAFEGIDGSGKTTVAGLLVDVLSRRGMMATQLRKRVPDIGPPFARAQLSALAERLWGIPHDDTIGQVGNLHWIYLNAAYFAGLRTAVASAGAPGEVVVIDNWINKFVARVSTNGEFTLDEVRALVRPVPQPDLVFLLDVPPSVAAARKPVPTALERGVLVRPDKDFVTYQATVRAALLRMAADSAWTIIDGGERPAADIADEIADLVLAKVKEQ